MLNLPQNRKWAVMGILNATPDSFYDGGKYTDNLRMRIDQMVADGVDIIDVGGESTRPGSKPVSMQEELKRVLPAIGYIRSTSNTIISCDTSKSMVAKEALMQGAHWINDVSAGRNDSKMATVVAEAGVPVVLMHSRKKPENMQDSPHYENPTYEVLKELYEAVSLFCESGVDQEKIILDPGIGFAKRVTDNLQLLREISTLAKEYPVLIGTSRKSFIGEITGSTVDKRLAGSLATVGETYRRGASIFRVHDVAETVDYLKMVDAIDGK